MDEKIGDHSVGHSYYYCSTPPLLSKVVVFFAPGLLIADSLIVYVNCNEAYNTLAG